MNGILKIFPFVCYLRNKLILLMLSKGLAQKTIVLFLKILFSILDRVYEDMRLSM